MTMIYEHQLETLFSPSSLQQLNQNGFGVIRNFFDASDLKAIYADLRALCEAFYAQAYLDMPHVADEEQDRLLVSFLKQQPALQSTLYDRLQVMPANLATPHHPKVRQLAQLLFGQPAYGVWPRLQVRLDLYQDTKNVIEWHHDYLYNQGTKHSWTLWMPLVNIEPDMGLLRIAPQTHTVTTPFEFTRTGGVNRFDYTLDQAVVDGLDLVMPDQYQAGDLVIFHSLVIHAGAENQNHERARLVTLFRIQDLTMLEAFQKQP